jgi:hypothetical protein
MLKKFKVFKIKNDNAFTHDLLRRQCNSSRTIYGANDGRVRSEGGVLRYMKDENNCCFKTVVTLTYTKQKYLPLRTP